MNSRGNARLLILACCVLMVAIPTIAQKPVVFDVSNVVMGTQRIPTLWILASGKWSDSGELTGPISTDIQCYKSLGFCAVANAFSSDGGANVALTTYDILRWDRQEMIAVDSSEVCTVSTIRVDLVTKRVTRSYSDKGSKDPLCKGSISLPTAVLWGSEDFANDAIKRAKSKK